MGGLHGAHTDFAAPHLWAHSSPFRLAEVFQLSWKPLFKVITADTHSSKATHRWSQIMYLRHSNTLNVSLSAEWEVVAESQLHYQGNSTYVQGAFLFLQNL